MLPNFDFYEKHPTRWICNCPDRFCVLSVSITQEETNFLLDTGYQLIVDGCYEGLPEAEYELVVKRVGYSIYKKR